MAVLTDANVRPLFGIEFDREVLQARYGAAVIMPRVYNRSSLVKEFGELINITIKPRLAGGTVGSDGGFTPETMGLTQVQVNVNTWRYVSVEITDKQSAQAIVDLENELPSQFGEKLAEFTDIDLANILDDATGFDGTTAGLGFGAPGVGTTFIEDTALGAVLRIRRRNVPLEDLSWILSPECYYLGWLTKERMTNANTTGLPQSVLTTNFRQKILNIPGYESTLLNGSTATDDSGTLLNAANGNNAAGTTACALIHKEYAAVAMQINNKYEKVRSTSAQRLATTIVNNNLYGLRTVRATHGVVMYIKNS